MEKRYARDPGELAQKSQVLVDQLHSMRHSGGAEGVGRKVALITGWIEAIRWTLKAPTPNKEQMDRLIADVMAEPPQITEGAELPTSLGGSAEPPQISVPDDAPAIASGAPSVPGGTSAAGVPAGSPPLS
jgi:hypothetical protein